MNRKSLKLTELLIPFSIFLALYSLTLCGVSTVAHDSIYYLNQIDSKSYFHFPYHPLFHSHHLLYNLSARLWLLFCRGVNINFAADLIIAWFNAIWGALALSVFYLILRTRLQAKPLAALLGTACCAFSFAFWFYSVSVEVYAPPLFWSLLLLYVLSADRFRSKDYYLIGLLHGLSIVYHQVNVLFGLVIISALLLDSRPLNLRSLLKYFACLIPTVAIPYLLVIFKMNQFAAWEDAWYWLTRFSHYPGFWQPLAFSTLLKAQTGFGRALIEGYFILGVPYLKTLMNKKYIDGFLWDEAFLVRNLSPATAWTLLLLALIFFLTLFIGIRYYSGNLRKVKENHSRLAVLTGVWLAVYSLFFFFWVPNNIEFWISQSVCCWLLFLILIFSGERGKTPPILFILPLLLLVINYGGNIRFIQNDNNDLYYSKISALSKELQTGDLVVVGPKLTAIPEQSWTSEALKAYLFRYTQADAIDLVELFRAAQPEHHKHNFSHLIKSIDNALKNGRRVFIYAEVMTTDRRTASYLTVHPFLLQQLRQIYQDRARKIDVGGETLYLLEPV
ncbi:MAG: DUF2723 domain-containing protein [Candidatus Schekmanbacteria bacterium]|nr:DUF2723 domain-containing protein [Candidatus Schekmanbacteria bacterium]